MRKITLTMLFSLVLAFSFAQTIVSTTPENKNGILEEFTGTHCPNCPDGHTIANSIKNNNPNDFYIINVHTGGYAVPGVGEPDFRTEFGYALANLSQLYGFPAATINRHYFGHSQQNATAGATALGRGTWASDFNTLKAQPSYVNVGVEANVDAATRELTVHVEAYYTSDSPVSTNLLNVALLQNHTIAPQAGGGLDYDHNHRLVYLLTGQWGETITTTTTGTFVDRTITYTVPADYRGVFADVSNLEVVAYITETHQEVISGKGVQVGVTSSLANDVNLYEVKNIIENCTGSLSPEIAIINQGSQPITSLDINYNFNSDASQVFTWTGNLETGQMETIQIPETAFSLLDDNTLNISAVIPNDGNVSNNTSAITFPKTNIIANNSNIMVEIQPDNYGSETTWKIYDLSDNSIVLSGGPYTDGNTNVVTANFTANSENCYLFEIKDGYGDGMDSGYGVGYYKVFSDGNLLLDGGSFGAVETKGFKTLSTLNVENDLFTAIEVYPNPTDTDFNIVNAEGFNMEMFNVLGEKVFVKKNISTIEKIDVSNFSKGSYFVKISNSKTRKTYKLIIK